MQIKMHYNIADAFVAIVAMMVGWAVFYKNYSVERVQCTLYASDKICDRMRS